MHLLSCGPLTSLLTIARCVCAQSIKQEHRGLECSILCMELYILFRGNAMLLSWCQSHGHLSWLWCNLHQQRQYIVTQAAVWLSGVGLTTHRGTQHSQVCLLKVNICMSVCRGSWQRPRSNGAILKLKLQKHTAIPGMLFWNRQSQNNTEESH